jgi:hypothetical protein
VDNTLLGADPPQLAVVDKVAPCLTPVGGQGRQRPALDSLGDMVDCGADNVVSTTNGECLKQTEAVSRWPLE